MHDQTTTGQAGEPARVPRRQPVAVLSGSVLRAARTGYGESREDFAARAGIGLHVVEGVEDGTLPAWDLPYATFTALGDAVSVLNPSLRDRFRDSRSVRPGAHLRDARRPGVQHRRAGRR